MSEELIFASEEEALQHLANLTKKQIKIAASDKYPELNKLAKEMADDIFHDINTAAKNVESEMPYKAQYVLEEIIINLEKMV